MTTLRNAGLDKLDHTLDPLMEIVSQYESEADLQQKIQHLFHSLISDPDSQVLSSQDFCTNIARKRFRGGSTVMVRAPPPLRPLLPTTQEVLFFSTCSAGAALQGRVRSITRKCSTASSTAKAVAC